MDRPIQVTYTHWPIASVVLALLALCIENFDFGHALDDASNA